MSYEGQEEYLCKRGHRIVTDAFDDFLYICPICDGQIEYHHPIDHTNGYDQYNPGTYPAAVEEIGYEDQWQEDHYGNKYAIKLILYKPASTEWRRL